MTKTFDNLNEAFAGEAQANRRYLAFAEIADKEGFSQVARLFRAAATAETVHAHNHLRAMGGIQNTQENLKVAIQGEHHEAVSMYPEFIEEAKNEMLADKENKMLSQGLKSFRWALEVEKEHEAFYSEALATLGSAGDDFDYYICPVCGHTHARNAPDKCPICGVDGSRFIHIQ